MLREIKVGDKFRGIYTKEIATVFYINGEYLALEYNDRTIMGVKIGNIFNSFEEIPVEKEKLFAVYYKYKYSKDINHSDYLYESKEQFITENGDKYEWIKLKEVVFED